MKTLTKVTKEDFAQQLTQGFNSRKFIISDIRNVTERLNGYEAFAFSRLLPKEILEKLLQEKSIGPFVDKILDYHIVMAKGGPLVEVANTQKAEETFLATCAGELLAYLVSR